MVLDRARLTYNHVVTIHEARRKLKTLNTTLIDARINMNSALGKSEVITLAQQLGIDVNLLMQEIQWALGEERINRVTPPRDQFREWARRKDGLHQFWKYANDKIGVKLDAEEIQDIWECIDLTLTSRNRHSFSFQEYLIVAMRSEQRCEICGKQPPEVALDIDHILPVSKGGTNNPLNLRFLCKYHNRSRGNRFRWADIWRRN
jgi:hypothetical protein